MSLTAHLRSLFRRGGGAIPKPPPLTPDEERVTLSPGRPVFDPLPRPLSDHCRPGRCMGLMCCSYECSQGRCPSIPEEFRTSTP